MIKTLIAVLLGAAILTGCVTNPPKTGVPRVAVKGKNGLDGYIDGTAAPKSKFLKLQVGMGQKEVTDLVGEPTDMKSNVTALAYIPGNFFSSNRYQIIYLYKGYGRLVFAGSSGVSSGSELIGIEHDSTERGYQ